MFAEPIILLCVSLTLSSPVFDHPHDHPRFPLHEPIFSEKFWEPRSLPVTDDFYDATAIKSDPLSFPNSHLEETYHPEQPELFPPPPPPFFLPPPPSPALMPPPPPVFPPPPPFQAPPPVPSPFFARPLPEFPFGPLPQPEIPPPLSFMPNFAPGPIAPVAITTMEYRIVRQIVHPLRRPDSNEPLPSLGTRPEESSEFYKPRFFSRPEDSLFEYPIEPLSEEQDSSKEFQKKKDLPYVPPALKFESRTGKNNPYEPPAFIKLSQQDPEPRSTKHSPYTPPAFVKLFNIDSKPRSSKQNAYVSPSLKTEEIPTDSVHSSFTPPAFVKSLKLHSKSRIAETSVLRSSKAAKHIPYVPPVFDYESDDDGQAEAQRRSWKSSLYVSPALKSKDAFKDDLPLVSSSDKVSEFEPAEHSHPNGKGYEIRARFSPLKEDLRGDQPGDLDDSMLYIIVD